MDCNGLLVSTINPVIWLTFSSLAKWPNFIHGINGVSTLEARFFQVHGGHNTAAWCSILDHKKRRVLGDENPGPTGHGTDDAMNLWFWSSIGFGQSMANSHDRGPQKVTFWKGNPLISEKSRLVKYDDLARLDYHYHLHGEFQKTSE